MKKLLILFTILTLSNLNAQEKQNDATWEETVSFINKYKDYISVDRYKYHYSKKNPDYYKQTITKDNWIINVKWSASQSYSNGYYSKTKDEHVNKILINKLKNVNLSTAGIYIYTTGNDITGKRTRYNNGKVEYQDSWKESDFYFEVPDDEIRPRLYKALQHLTYLATKKREEARKNSGEKF